MEFTQWGIPTLPGQNAFEAGINRVKERMQNDKLYVMDNCTNLIKEFIKYRWRDAPRSGEDGKPLPVKTEDHLLDALRYVCMSRPYAPKIDRFQNESQIERAMRHDRERAGRVRPSGPYGPGIFD